MAKEGNLAGLQIRDVPDIWAPSGSAITTEDDINRLIELPLRKA